MTKRQAVEDFCFQRSWRLRCRREDSRWLIGLAQDALPDRPPEAVHDRYEDWHVTLDNRLREAVPHRYGNPVVVWMLLNIIVPLVVKLVLEWWFDRKE
jgi:hypothetical protein